jgi:hypothetical protein
MASTPRHLELPRKLAVLILVVLPLGLPITSLWSYGLILAATVLVLTGCVKASRTPWLAALALTALSILGQTLFPAPRIDEGHNIFVVAGPGGALETGLPPAAFQLMKTEFDALHPPERRAGDPRGLCWADQRFPDRPFAFSADGVFDRPALSRRVTGIDFADPVWLRLGAANEFGFNAAGALTSYNWYDHLCTDLKKREATDSLLHPWRLLMPWFVMYRLPADFIGSTLCWTGEVLWEGPQNEFTPLRHASDTCRTIAPADVNRRIFGVSIAKAPPLAMRLRPTTGVRIRQAVERGLALIAAVGVLFILVDFRWRRTVVPSALIALAGLGAFVRDASFFGGYAPQGGGGDGIFYQGVGRLIVQELFDGHVGRALEGGERVFYANPGMRYFRAAEALIFGDTNFGYLSLLLLLPILLFGLMRRFLPVRWALVLVVLFLTTRLGDLFGSSFTLWTMNAVHGFGDAAGYILFLAGLLVLVGATSVGPGGRFTTAFGAALLLAIAVPMRPPLLVAAGVLLSGAALAALYHRQFARIAGLCCGFLPIVLLPLHNWVFGGVFVPISNNVSAVAVLGPGDAVGALHELARLDFGGDHLDLIRRQFNRYMSGPSVKGYLMPLHVAAIAILVWVAGWGERFGFWLRLIAGAMIAQALVSLLFLFDPRYFLLNWVLTSLVVMVWLQMLGVPYVQRRHPDFARRIVGHPISTRFGRALSQLIEMAGLTEHYAGHSSGPGDSRPRPSGNPS